MIDDPGIGTRSGHQGRVRFEYANGRMAIGRPGKTLVGPARVSSRGVPRAT
jgi:hypothetical protein